MLPTIINKIDDCRVIFNGDTSDRKTQPNVFAGLIWEFKPEVKLLGFDPSSCLDILVKTLDVHLPDRKLGERPLLGSSISKVSFMHLWLVGIFVFIVFRCQKSL